MGCSSKFFAYGVFRVLRQQSDGCTALQDQQDQRQDQEHSADPLRCPRQLCIHRLGLVLGQEGISHAADAAGQTGAFAGLEQNHQDDRQTAEQLKNRDDERQSGHSEKPPKFQSCQRTSNVFAFFNSSIVPGTLQEDFSKKTAAGEEIFETTGKEGTENP